MSEWRARLDGENAREEGLVPPPPAAGPGAPPADEPVLLERCAGGDREAFDEILGRYYGRIYSFCRRLLGPRRELAEDLTQEVFLRAWRGMATFKLGSRFSTWLFQIALNYWIQEYRKGKALKRRGVTLSIDKPLGGEDSDYHIEPRSREPDPAQAAFTGEMGRAILAAIDRLDPDQRAAVVMCDLEGLSYEEIGRALDIPVGTVRSRIHRGRARLQGELERYL